MVAAWKAAARPITHHIDQPYNDTETGIGKRTLICFGLRLIARCPSKTVFRNTSCERKTHGREDIPTRAKQQKTPAQPTNAASLAERPQNLIAGQDYTQKPGI
jgi:hypothetical protein